MDKGILWLKVFKVNHLGLPDTTFATYDICPHCYTWAHPFAKSDIKTNITNPPVNIVFWQASLTCPANLTFSPRNRQNFKVFSDLPADFL